MKIHVRGGDPFELVVPDEEERDAFGRYMSVVSEAEEAIRQDDIRRFDELYLQGKKDGLRIAFILFADDPDDLDDEQGEFAAVASYIEDQSHEGDLYWKGKNDGFKIAYPLLKEIRADMGDNPDLTEEVESRRKWFAVSQATTGGVLGRDPEAIETSQEREAIERGLI